MNKLRKKIISDLLIESSVFNKSSKVFAKKLLNSNIIRYSYKIESERQAKMFGKQEGEYILFDCEDLNYFDKKLQNTFINNLTKEIKRMVNELIPECNNVLVVGFGNKNMLADCLGDKVVERIFTTRHLKKQGIESVRNCATVSCFSCNVYGKTGIESAEIVKQLVNIVKPDLVICVDTFVASSVTRLGKSVQICSCGLTPGSGVGNHRKNISKEYIGVPVFTIGVPLLIAGATLAGSLQKKYNKQISDLVVMDKEIEKYVKYFAIIIANSINLAVNKNITLKQINDLTY